MYPLHTPRVLWLGGPTNTAPVLSQEQPRDGPAQLPVPGPKLLTLKPLCLCLPLSVAVVSPLPPPPTRTVLSIHKLPASGATDISFPMKGWRATGDWAKVPEDRVTVSKSVFSTGLAGEGLRGLEGLPRV